MIVSKVPYDGSNTEAFVSKFRHLAEAYKVSPIFFNDYGRNPPALDHRDFAAWASMDSKAFRLLEKSVTDEIWSLVRDRQEMSARDVYDVLARTCLRGTVRSTAQIEYDMEVTRMDGKATVSSHISTMCRFFRELEQSGHPLNDEQKIVKSMAKMSERWYRLADDFMATRDGDTSFDVFRMKMIKMEVDSRYFRSSRFEGTESSFTSRVTNRQNNQNRGDQQQQQATNFHSAIGSRGRAFQRYPTRGRGQQNGGRTPTKSP